MLESGKYYSAFINNIINTIYVYNIEGEHIWYGLVIYGNIDEVTFLKNTNSTLTDLGFDAKRSIDMMEGSAWGKIKTKCDIKLEQMKLALI